MRASGPVAAYIDRQLPKRLQTFVSLYASWLEKLRAQPALAHSPIRRLIRVLLIDILCLLGIVTGDAIALKRLLPIAVTLGWRSPVVIRIAIAVLAFGISLPFWIGIVRSARKLGSELAGRAIPTVHSDQTDLGAAPRKALRLTFEIVVLLLAGGPLVIVSQLILPSLPGLLGGLLWIGLLGVLGVGFWRSASQLDGHVRAGAAAVVEALAAQAAPPEGEAALPPIDAVGDVSQLLAGLGSLATEVILSTHAGAGKTLAELNLRGLSGATVLAIARGSSAAAVPTATQKLAAGDVLVLTGSSQSVAQAQQLLRGPLPDDANRSHPYLEVIELG
jgi:CPA2 family monovalent cation:H+ antiporter-2